LTKKSYCKILGNELTGSRIDIIIYSDDDDDVYLNKLQTKGVKKSILYMYNVDQPIRHK
jgi:transcription antitermination factor NusA-like protein